MDYTITISPRHAAGLQAAANADNASHGTSLTPGEYLSLRVNDVLDSYADAFAIGVLTPFAFVQRFTPAEYARIVDLASTNPVVAGLLARLEVVSSVHLFNEEAQQGVGYLTTVPASDPIISPARAATILTP
jgi:hypothetical protein